MYKGKMSQLDPLFDAPSTNRHFSNTYRSKWPIFWQIDQWANITVHASQFDSILALNPYLVTATWVGAEVGDVSDNGWAVDAARTQGPRSNSCGSRNVVKRFLKLQSGYMNDLYVSVCHPAVFSALTINGEGDVLLGARIQFWWSGSATNGCVRAKPPTSRVPGKQRKRAGSSLLTAFSRA